MENPIILFDGVCNFCNSSVNFIIERDQQAIFRFAPLQSETGKNFVDKFGLNELDSIILVEDEKAFAHSTAALRIAKRLGGVMSLIYFFIIIPRPIRDFFYKLFAKNRYRLFGKKEACMLPTPQVRSRFLS